MLVTMNVHFVSESMIPLSICTTYY